MATTKTSKAKTKTTKAKTPTKKTAPKKTTARAAKTAAPKTSAKATAAKNSPVKAVTTTVQKLRSLHLVSAGVFLLLAVLAGVFMSNDSYQLTLGHVTRDEIGGNLVPAVQAIYDVELRWLVVIVMVLSAVLPVLYLTRLKKAYENFLTKSRMQPLRWIDFAVTGALMTEVVALLSGVSDLPTLKLVAGLVVATGVISLIAERQNNTTAKPVRSAYYTSLFTGLLPWAFIAAYAVTTIVYAAFAPWYIYALYAVVLGGYALLARNQHMEFRQANYLVVERNYVVIGLLTKAAFAAVLIAGFLR